MILKGPLAAIFKELEDRIICPDCRDVLKAPVKLSCNCYTCLDCAPKPRYEVNTKKYVPKCPGCDEIVDEMKRDEKMERIVNSKLVTCPKEKCLWEGTFENYAYHCKYECTEMTVDSFGGKDLDYIDKLHAVSKYVPW